MHEQKFKDLLSSTCQGSVDRRVLDLESDVHWRPGVQYFLGVTFSLWDECWHCCLCCVFVKNPNGFLFLPRTKLGLLVSAKKTVFDAKQRLLGQKFGQNPIAHQMSHQWWLYTKVWDFLLQRFFTSIWHWGTSLYTKRLSYLYLLHSRILRSNFFLISCSFLGKFLCWLPLLEGWGPLLRKSWIRPCFVKVYSATPVQDALVRRQVAYHRPQYISGTKPISSGPNPLLYPFSRTTVSYKFAFK